MMVRCGLCCGTGKNPARLPAGDCDDCLGAGSIPDVQACALAALTRFAERLNVDPITIGLSRDNLPPAVVGQYSFKTQGLVSHQKIDLAGQISGAVLSPCGLYRYYLSRIWNRDAAPLVFWLLNPSRADHEKTDPTLTGLIARARLWGFGGVVIINLFAFRATDPADMKAAPDPVGPDNDIMIRTALAHAAGEGSPVICGWGRHGSHRGQDQVAIAIAASLDVPLMALDRNADGSPMHPLYIPHSKRPERFE